jgi:DNA-binding LacI/PurR family transcriptional regulator
MSEIRQQEIANELGLSVSTVSLALRNSPQVAKETRLLVWETAKRLGYSRPASPDQRSEIKRLTYISPIAAANVFYGQVLHGAEAASRQRNIALHYSRLEELNAWALEHYQEADGLLLVGSIAPQVIEKLKGLDRPMVLVDNNLPQMGLDQVVTKNYDSVFRVVKKLYEWGHRKIIFLRGPEGFPSFVERLQGYHAALESLNLEPGEILCESMEDQCVDRALTEFLKNPKKPGVTALVAFNDSAAIEAHHTLQNLGIRIPEELALVGFDDLDMARMLRPSLTTCRVEREMLGKLGIERLLERINNPKAPTVSFAIDTTFIVRQSAVPPQTE